MKSSSIIYTYTYTYTYTIYCVVKVYEDLYRVKDLRLFDLFLFNEDL